MKQTEQIAECLDALGNPVRLDLFRALIRAGGEGRSVGQIQEVLNIPASTLSHHLKLLELVGLVNRGKQGTTHFVSANIGMMDEVIDFLTRECCADREDHDHDGEHGPVPSGIRRGHWHKD